MKTMNFIQAVDRSKFLNRKLTTIEKWEFHFTLSNTLYSLNIPFYYDSNDSFIIEDDYVDDFFYIIKSVIENYFNIEYGDDMDELLEFFNELQK